MRKGIFAVYLSVFMVIFGSSWSFAQQDHLTCQAYGDRNVHDVNKKVEDNKMCWASAAANILDWTDRVIPEYSNADAIYQNFLSSWTNGGGRALYAWQWWFEGMKNLPCWLQPDYSCCGTTLDPQCPECASSCTRCSLCPGDWATVAKNGQYWIEDPFFENYQFYGLFHEEKAMKDVVACLLDKGYGVIIIIYQPGVIVDNALRHALSVWGYQTDPNGEVTNLLITDSDDGIQPSQTPQPQSTPSQTLTPQTLPVAFANGKWQIGSNSMYSGYLIESIEALASRDSSPRSSPPISCDELPQITPGTTFVTFSKKCVEAQLDSNGEPLLDQDGRPIPVIENEIEKEIPCEKGKNGEFTISVGETSYKCDSECTSLTIASPEGTRGLRVTFKPDTRDRDNKVVGWVIDWGISQQQGMDWGGDYRGDPQIRDQQVTIGPLPHIDFCLRPTIAHCRGE